MSDAAARVLPHSIDAEKSVIGGVLVQGKAFDEVADLVEARDFYHPAHEAIYRAMCDLAAASKPIDPLTVAEQMRASDTYGNLRGVNGEMYFTELTGSVLTVENIAYYAKIVASKAARRALMQGANEIYTGGFGAVDDGTFIEDAERRILELMAERREAGGPVRVSAGLRGFIRSIEARRAAPGGVVGVPSGWAKLDDLLTGYKAATLNVVAARPKMGKTSFACGIALHVALVARIPVLFFSLEMQGVDVETGGELLERMACIHARVDGQNARTGMLEKGEWLRLQRALSDLSEAPIDVDDQPAQTLARLRSRARRWRMRQGAGPKALVIVDYLQLMRHPQPKGRDANREREVAEIAEGLKALSKEIKAPVLALAQLNRSCEARNDKRPLPSDLRESGAIEQACDSLAFIYRDEVYHPDTKDKGVAEIIVSMQRNGPTGTARLKWFPEYTRFDNLAERDDYQQRSA